MVKRICHKCYAEFDRKSSYDKHTYKKFDCSLKYNKATENEENPLKLDNLQELTISCKSCKSDKIIDKKMQKRCKNLNEKPNIDEKSNVDKPELSCPHCNKTYSSKYTLERHMNDYCKIKKEKDKMENIHTKELSEIKQQLQDIKNENIELKKQMFKIIPKNNELVKINKSIKNLETNIPANTNLNISNQFIEKLIQKEKEIEELTIKQVYDKEYEKLLFEDTKKIKNNSKITIVNDKSNVIDIKELLFADIKENNNNKDDNKDIIEEFIIEDNKQMTLILNNDAIECRKTDGYINATQLCKAGNKKFNDWLRLESTKNYLVSMETNTGIPALELIDKNIGGNHIGTWIHPKVAINLAQWLSPDFAVLVSNWIYDLMTKGKVEVNIKLLKEQENIIKTCKSRIKHLEDRILKRHPRPKYDNSKFVVYLATNKKSMKERIYTVGLARDLSQRLTKYDKLDDHFPVYYKAFNTEQQMIVAEDMVLEKLYVYRAKESKDRFILPAGKDIKLFTKAIDDAVNFFNN